MRTSVEDEGPRFARSPLVLTDKTRDRCFLERTEKDDYHDEETISISERNKGKR